MIAFRRRQADNRLWALRVETFTHLKQSADREAIVRQLQDDTRIGIERKTAFDVADDDARLRMIGCNIGAFGPRYLDRYPEQAEWLAGKGLTPADAVSRYAAWRAEQLAHPFWSGIGSAPHGDDG